MTPSKQKSFRRKRLECVWKNFRRRYEVKRAFRKTFAMQKVSQQKKFRDPKWFNPRKVYQTGIEPLRARAVKLVTTRHAKVPVTEVLADSKIKPKPLAGVKIRYEKLPIPK